jgi:hypothetical protein
MGTQKTVKVLWMTPGLQKEATANAAITPGHLVELMSTGKLRVHATAGGSAQRAFALEDELQGRPITTAYTAANKAQYGIFRAGDVVNAILYNGETAIIGSFLESQGDGTLRVVDVDSAFTDISDHSIVGVALEAVDMSGSTGADPSARILIEIM